MCKNWLVMLVFAGFFSSGLNASWFGASCSVDPADPLFGRSCASAPKNTGPFVWPWPTTDLLHNISIFKWAAANSKEVERFGEEILTELPELALAKRKAIYKYFVDKALCLKCHPKVRAWSACLALCVADARFATKKVLDRLMSGKSEVAAFKDLPLIWQQRAKKNYGAVVSKLGSQSKEIKHLIEG